MGFAVGVFDDSEMEGISEADKALLKQHVLQQIQTSPEILAIISEYPKLLTENEHIRNVLKGKAGELQRRLKR
jgi:hypothetical protein